FASPDTHGVNRIFGVKFPGRDVPASLATLRQEHALTRMRSRLVVRATLFTFVCLEGGEAAVAPAHLRGNRRGIERIPLQQDALQGRAPVDGGISRAQTAEARTVAVAIIRNAARRVEFDR